MTYIPTTRNKFETDIYGREKTPRVLNGYYEGLLEGADEIRLKSRDFTVEDMKTFFANLEVYEEELREAGFDVNKVNTAVFLKDELEDGEFETLNDETKLMATVFSCLLDHMESARQTEVVSMIDNMDENVHKERYEALKRNEGLS